MRYGLDFRLAAPVFEESRCMFPRISRFLLLLLAHRRRLLRLLLLGVLLP